MTAPVVLVVAKAPSPGQAKTRLTPPLSPDEAAELAAGALLDTLDVAQAAAASLGSGPVVVALAGDPRTCAQANQLAGALRACRVVAQRGASLAERLVAAHADAAGRGGVVQIGMDTPQLGPAAIEQAAQALGGAPAVLGPATDGGWWLLALRDAGHAAALAGVAMSTPGTHAATLAALASRGLRVAAAPTLRDVDTIDDVRAVAALAPGTRFGRIAAALMPEAAGGRLPWTG